MKTVILLVVGLISVSSHAGQIIEKTGGQVVAIERTYTFDQSDCNNFYTGRPGVFIFRVQDNNGAPVGVAYGDARQYGFETKGILVQPKLLGTEGHIKGVEVTISREDNIPIDSAAAKEACLAFVKTRPFASQAYLMIK